MKKLLLGAIGILFLGIVATNAVSNNTQVKQASLVIPTGTPTPTFIPIVSSTPTPSPIPTITPTSIPYVPPVNSCTGATALCSDGSCSYSANRRGTCSHHGGVSVWYP